MKRENPLYFRFFYERYNVNKFYKFMDVKNLTYQVKLNCFQREQSSNQTSSDSNMNLSVKRMRLKNEGNYL